MPENPAKSKSPAAVGNYAVLLTDIKQWIRAAQVRTSMANNVSVLMLY